MNSNNLVSIIISVYNSEKTIDDCINRPGWLESKSHTYTDGSTMTARVYCRKLGSFLN